MCRALEELQRRVSDGAVSNGGTKEAERQAAERVSAAAARATRAESDAAAVRAELNTLKGSFGNLLKRRNSEKSFEILRHPI